MRHARRSHPARGGVESSAPPARRGRTCFLASLFMHTAVVTALAGTYVLHLRTEPRPAEFSSDYAMAETLEEVLEPPSAPEIPPPDPLPEVLAEEAPDDESLPPQEHALPLPAPPPMDLLVEIPDRPCWRERPPAPPSPPPPPPPPVELPRATPRPAPALASVVPAGPSRRAAPRKGNRPPVYPAAAEAARMQGVVLLVVHIGADGAVLGVEVKRSSGFALLDREAVRAVRNWRFEPALESGRPVAAAAELPIRFVLP
ncbi:MAG: TonB family protein [Planctomycetes bacterium]|nr:TonB family protein [Planctomycetota bacterium]